MTGRRRICLVSYLALATIFLYTWSYVNLLWPSDDHSHLLAEDMLRAASGSVHEAMRSLLEAYDDELRITSGRGVVDSNFGPKFERLLVSLDNLHQESSQHRNIALEEPPDLRVVQGRRVADMHQIDMCASLAGKRITMIGGEHIYRLHVHLLQHRERAEGKLFPCQYHEFCTHHHICLPYKHFREDIPLPRYIKPPTTQELVDTESAVVNYLVSDSLFSSRNESSREYTLPYVDPMTGVRLRETYWLAAARKANIVILGRGPLSAPAQTYTGNWSFLRHLPDYVDRSRDDEHHDDAHAYQPVPRSPEILNAAVDLTVSRFLPDVFQLLRVIRREVRPGRRKRLIWPSYWYRLPGRGAARTILLRPHVRATVQDMMQQTFSHRRRPRSPAEHVLTLQLSALINADVMNTALREDPWTLLFNAQVYLQNMVLRELLPRFGIVFLPLDIPWVEDVQARGHEHGYSHGDAVDVDFERTAAIGEAFLTRLDYVLGFLE